MENLGFKVGLGLALGLEVGFGIELGKFRTMVRARIRVCVCAPQVFSGPWV